jgi:DNA invertase Pin-like site-specific DNA recombinase
MRWQTPCPRAVAADRFDGRARRWRLCRRGFARESEKRRLATRPGFNRLLDRIEGNGVRVVIIEDASRFACDLMTQELGILSLIKLGVRVITAGGDELTDTSDAMKVAMRQIAGSFAQLEKTRIVAKLKGARDRKKAEGKRTTLDGRGKCEGGKSLAELRPDVVEAARKLNDGRSLRKVAAGLAEKGFTTPAGKHYSATSVKRMLGAMVSMASDAALNRRP